MTTDVASSVEQKLTEALALSAGGKLQSALVLALGAQREAFLLPMGNEEQIALRENLLQMAERVIKKIQDEMAMAIRELEAANAKMKMNANENPRALPKEELQKAQKPEAKELQAAGVEELNDKTKRPESFLDRTAATTKAFLKHTATAALAIPFVAGALAAAKPALARGKLGALALLGGIGVVAAPKQTLKIAAVVLAAKALGLLPKVVKAPAKVALRGTKNLLGITKTSFGGIRRFVRATPAKISLATKGFKRMGRMFGGLSARVTPLISRVANIGRPAASPAVSI